MTTTDRDTQVNGAEGKLPKWAQNELARLRRHLADAEARLAAGPENSDTWAEPHSGVPLPLGVGTMIRFGSQEHHFDVRYTDGELGVHYTGTATHGHRIAVLPGSSNSLKLTGFPELSLVQRFIAHQVEQTLGSYPGNGAQRPRVGVGEYLTDAQWAAEIVRQWTQ